MSKTEMISPSRSSKKPSENSLTAPQRSVAGDLASFRIDTKWWMGHGIEKYPKQGLMMTQHTDN
jgi:hypothetical protein